MTMTKRENIWKGDDYVSVGWVGRYGNKIATLKKTKKCS